MKLTTLLACGMAAFLASCQPTEEYKYESLYADLPFEMPRVEAPSFPDNEVNLSDFGAVGDGTQLCTEAFARAIDALSQKGGGRLTVPAGVWFTGPIVLKSNINLHVEKGAVILFSPDIDLYPLVETVFEGLDTRRCQSPISGRNLTNVAITGQGAIDGNGHFWRPLKRQKVTESQWKAAFSPSRFTDFTMEGKLVASGEEIATFSLLADGSAASWDVAYAESEFSVPLRVEQGGLFASEEALVDLRPLLSLFVDSFSDYGYYFGSYQSNRSMRDNIAIKFSHISLIEIRLFTFLSNIENFVKKKTFCKS